MAKLISVKTIIISIEEAKQILCEKVGMPITSQLVVSWNDFEDGTSQLKDITLKHEINDEIETQKPGIR